MFVAPWLLAASPAPSEFATSLLQDAAPPPAAAKSSDSEKQMRLTFALAMRSMDQTFWEPLDEPFTLEADLEWRLEDSFVGFEIGTAISYDESNLFGIDVDASTYELFGGVRATADLVDGHLRPYVGAGPSLIFANVGGESSGFRVSDDDVSFGLYLRGGVTWVFDGGFGLGLDYRKLVGTDVSLFGVDGDADFDQFGLTFGFAF